MPHHSDGSAVTRRHFVGRVSSAAIGGLVAAARPVRGAEQPAPAQPSRDDQVSDLVAATERDKALPLAMQMGELADLTVRAAVKQADAAAFLESMSELERFLPGGECAPGDFQL